MCWCPLGPPLSGSPGDTQPSVRCRHWESGCKDMGATEYPRGRACCQCCSEVGRGILASHHLPPPWAAVLESFPAVATCGSCVSRVGPRATPAPAAGALLTCQDRSFTRLVRPEQARGGPSPSSPDILNWAICKKGASTAGPAGTVVWERPSVSPCPARHPEGRVAASLGSLVLFWGLLPWAGPRATVPSTPGEGVRDSLARGIS